MAATGDAEAAQTGFDESLRGAIPEEKIFCIGLSKTGTTSFGQAMQRLGYRHRTGGFAGILTPETQDQALDVIRSHDSFDDLPWPFMVPFCLHVCRDIKFVLTVRRDSEAWIKSVKGHFDFVGPKPIAKRFYGHWMPHDNEADFLAIYETHNREMRARFAGDPRFVALCWEHGDGWRELCDFLGRPEPVPAQPFPHGKKRRMAEPVRAGHARISNLLGRYENGRFDSVADLLAELDDIAQPLYRVHMTKSRLYEDIGDLDRALAHAEQAREGALKGRRNQIEDNIARLIARRADRSAASRS